jgi:hypothetical protein
MSKSQKNHVHQRKTPATEQEDPRKQPQEEPQTRKELVESTDNLAY